MINAKPKLIDNCFKAYLYKTARNLALRYIEKHRRNKIFSLEDLKDEPESEILVEKLVQSEEHNIILRKCMDQLKPDYSEVLYLLYFENMNYAQAAQVMGKSVKQIDLLLERGKKRLRQLLEKEGITDANYR